MIYKKQDAVMTRGLAIIAMVCLHLFCKLGTDIDFQPFIWISDNKPLVYWLGFFSEICVPIYSMCAGYAQFLLYKTNRYSYKERGRRILKLLKNYWIILVFFCLVGFVVGSQTTPGDWKEFLLNVVLIHRYTGVWWYLRAYITILLLPAFITMIPVEKINGYLGIVLCFGLNLLCYIWSRFLFPDLKIESQIADWFYHLFYDVLLHVLPLFLLGAFLCKIEVFDKLNCAIKKAKKEKPLNIFVITTFIIIFVVSNLLEKSVLMAPIALLVFIGFNLIKKPKWLQNVFVILGKHSTNIWLIHSIFVYGMLKQYVFWAKYPILIFILVMVFCICISYLEKLIEKLIDNSVSFIKKKRLKVSNSSH